MILFIQVALTVVLAASAIFVASRRLARMRSRPRWALCAASVLAYAALLATQPTSWILSNLIVLAAGATVGSLLGRLLSSDISVIAFCVAIAIVDVFSFTGGLTARIIEAYRDGSSDLLRYVSVSVPLADVLQPVVGIGELWMLGAIYFSLSRLGYSGLGLYLAPLVGLLAALVVGWLTGGIFGLPFIAATTIAYILVRRRLANQGVG